MIKGHNMTPTEYVYNPVIKNDPFKYLNSIYINNLCTD